MSFMKNPLWIAVVIVSGLNACNYTDGECYPPGQGGGNAGVGGSIIVPNGAGGFGEIPREPQDATVLPECNIMPASPCNDKCLTDYEVAAAQCGKIENEAQRKSCKDGAYAVYKGCRDDCARNGNSDCDDKYQDCVDNGPKSCLKEEAGKTLCNRCWERCNAGDSPSGKCRRCKF